MCFREGWEGLGREKGDGGERAGRERKKKKKRAARQTIDGRANEGARASDLAGFEGRLPHPRACSVWATIAGREDRAKPWLRWAWRWRKRGRGRAHSPPPRPRLFFLPCSAAGGPASHAIPRDAPLQRTGSGRASLRGGRPRSLAAHPRDAGEKRGTHLGESNCSSGYEKCRPRSLVVLTLSLPRPPRRLSLPQPFARHSCPARSVCEQRPAFLVSSPTPSPGCTRTRPPRNKKTRKPSGGCRRGTSFSHAMPALYLLYESAHGYALLEAYGLDAIGGTSVDGVQKSVTELDRFGKVRMKKKKRGHAAGGGGGGGERVFWWGVGGVGAGPGAPSRSASRGVRWHAALHGHMRARWARPPGRARLRPRFRFRLAAAARPAPLSRRSTSPPHLLCRLSLPRPSSGRQACRLPPLCRRRRRAGPNQRHLRIVRHARAGRLPGGRPPRRGRRQKGQKGQESGPRLPARRPGRQAGQRPVGGRVHPLRRQ